MNDQLASNEPIIRLVDVCKSFGPLTVLDHVSLDIMPGQNTVILGPSGTGKSVLLKHIIGLLKPDHGEVWYQGQRIDQMTSHQLVTPRKQFGFLFQMGALFDSLNVEENICFPLTEHTTMTRAQKKERCLHVLNAVGLEGIEDKMPADLSGGQKKRVALARAIVLEPKVVLYDEPTTGLDPVRADLINELILSLSKRLGITSIVVTHDMASAKKIADRMIMLYDGHVVADDPTEKFLATSNNMVRNFINGKAEEEELAIIRRGI